jgi:hypothetical protein
MRAESQTQEVKLKATKHYSKVLKPSGSLRADVKITRIDSFSVSILTPLEEKCL